MAGGRRRERHAIGPADLEQGRDLLLLPGLPGRSRGLRAGLRAGGRYLRRLREGILCEGKRIDHAEALIAEAGPAGLDVARFEIDLRSNANVELFGAQLEEARRDPGSGAGGGAPAAPARSSGHVPSVTFIDADGGRHGVYGWQPYELYLEAAAAAGADVGAADGPKPEPLAVIERFGRAATAEIVAITGRPRVVVEAELWALAREWRLRPVNVLTGTLWELAG